MNRRTLFTISVLTAFAAGAQAQIRIPDKMKKLTMPTAAKAPEPGGGTTPSGAGTPTVTATANGLTMEMTFCERVVMDGASKFDVKPVNPVSAFPFKGTQVNVVAFFRFTPLADPSKVMFKVKVMKNGSFEDDRDLTPQTGGKTGVAAFTLRPGNYEMILANKFDDSKEFLKNTFTVAADAVGERVSGNTKTGLGKLMVCKEVDDSWKCVGESAKWKAGQPFNFFLELPQGVTAGMTLTRWVIHKQNADGKDGAYVNDLVQDIGKPEYRKWATVEGFRMPAGKYTIYSIPETEGQTTRTGNFTKYFGKATLIVE